jgi:exopolysaccharide biosynthesis WecB/TagA/CpsF family protein
MHILFLTSQVPYPPESGATIKTASVLEYLRRRHEVDVVCFRRGPLTEDQAAWAKEAGHVETVELSRARSAFNLLRSYLGRVPLSIQRNQSRKMKDLVAARLREGGFGAVFVDGWLMAQYVPKGFRGRALLHEHNAEHVLWRRQAERERNPAVKVVAGLEHRRVRRYESAMIRRFDVVFAVSETDRGVLVGLGGDPERVRVLPNLPDASLLERPALSFAATEPMLLYFGTLSWPPNVEGLDYLLRSVFPLVRRQMDDVRLVIAGQGAPSRLERLARRTDGVEFLGAVQDVEPLYRRARVFVEASRSGGGTRLKVLNALARGLPVVTSPEGAEGLDVVAGEHVLVAEDAESMANAVVRLIADDGMWRSLSENGRRLIRMRYLADEAFRVLDESPGLAVEVLGVRFDSLSRSEAARAIAEMATSGRKGYVVKPYSEFMSRAHRDGGVRKLLRGAELCLPDGVGILWAAHYLSLPGGRRRATLQLPLSLITTLFNPGGVAFPLRENMAGVDLTWEMLERLDEAGASVYLLGGTEEEVRGTKARIEERFPGLGVVGARDGYFAVDGPENAAVIEEINRVAPDVLLVAMGFPRQEEWIAANLPRLDVRAAVAEGGSFSFISGAAPRAPERFRRFGLEWLFRLLIQPARLRRQLALPRFVWLTYKERLRKIGS